MRIALRVAMILSALIGGAVTAQAGPSYTSQVFATSLLGASKPDSVALGAGSVWVSYDGGALSSDGSSPAGFSTIVRYSLSGAVQSTYQIGGDVDGLKYNPGTGDIWAIQNQDANSHLTLINPVTNATTPVSFAATSTTQGYDDVAFTLGGTFLSYTNPSAKSDVTLRAVVPGTSPIQVTDLATAGTPGKNLVTGADGYVLPTANTDTLKVAPNGDLVQTTGSRDTIAFISNPGAATQAINYLPLSASGAPVFGLDDTLYLTSASGRIYASVTNANQVVTIDYTGVTPGTLIGSIGSLSEIGFIDPSTGNVTPFVGNLSGIHGLDVVTAVPEPSSLALLFGGALSLFGLCRRRSATGTAIP